MARHSLVPLWILTGICVWLLVTSAAWAQEDPVQEGPKQAAAGKVGADEQSSPSEKIAKTGGGSSPEAEFQVLFAKWKGVIEQLRDLRTEWKTASDGDRSAVKKQWRSTLAKGEQLLPELIESAVAAYKTAPNEDRRKTRWLAKAVNDYVARDRYQAALEIATVLVDHDCDLPVGEVARLYRNAGIAAFAMNQYQQMEELLAKAQEKRVVSEDNIKNLKADLENYREAWKREQELRAREAKADDLPRVKLTTNLGDIVVELYENEAPETVGNFIYLIKQGFYDGLTFHRVQSGFVAQTGCPHGDGTGGPGYTIYDECDRSDARKHFRGVLSMANRNVPNSGNSQFFITFRPAPHLDGRHTVFGRVIEGMDVVTRLRRRDPEDPKAPEPDKIVKAEVLRDRGHEYLPNKVK